MRFLKRLAGAIAVFLGGVGVIAGLAGFVGTWVVRGRVDGVVVTVVDRVDVALSKLEAGTSRANQRIEQVRDSCRELNQRVQQRVAEFRDVPVVESPDIDELERQFRARIQLGRDWIGFVTTGVDLVEQVLQMLNSTSLLLQTESKTHADIVAAVRAGQKEIDEALRLADELGTYLEDIRAHRNLEESAAQIQTLSSQIDKALTEVQRFGADFEAGVAQARADAANLGFRIRRLVLIVALVVTLLLVWFAASQVSLMVHGWRFLRS